MVPRRLRRLPVVQVAGAHARVAISWRTRLLGLAFLREAPPRTTLLIPRCRSVHTFGMRFAIDVLFLDRNGAPLRVVRGVPPRRVVSCKAAAAVIERPAAGSEMIPLVAGEQRNKLLVALDPRQPIYRDAYNEYFVMVLSAGGAAAGTQVPLYIVMALTDLWSVVVFVLACVAFELIVVFGLARPQMTPVERTGWATLWAGTTALLAYCFYYLVAEPTL